jgi:predicted dehydrogenase
VGHLFRFAPVAQAVKAAIDAGRIGEPRYLQGHFMGFKRPRSDGGAAISDGIHWVDLASWLLGRPPKRATATLRDCLGRGMDDVALLTLDYGGALAQLEAGYLQPEARRDLVVMGSEGSIVCDFLAKDEPVRLHAGAHHQEADGRWSAVEGKRAALPVADGEPLLDELRAFVEACQSRTLSATACGGLDGAAAVAVIEACQRSAHEGRRVGVKLPIPPSRESR